MKIIKTSFLFLFLMSMISYGQEKDSTVVFKKRVLESAEVDFLVSYYDQDGTHSAVSGGIGSEKLNDLASNIIVAMPLNDDDVLTVDLGLSAYTSASSSNINPFNSTSGASGGGDDDGDDNSVGSNSAGPTPWQASSGASGNDILISAVANYTHNSDDRNFIWNADVSVSSEYDYTSVGFGGGVTKLFNEKNTEVSVKANAYIDQWQPIYPTELHEYSLYGSDFQNQGYFKGVTILDQNGMASTNYLPSKFAPVTSVNRNSYSASFAFSQVLTKNFQFSVFFDILQQQGLLSSPYHRMYFADKANYYIGQPEYIKDYTSPSNNGVYELSDDIERLPDNRFKLPIGARFNYYINEHFIVRTYYRYYTDDWDLSAHTFNIEVPVKFSDKFTAYPMYRYYTQTKAKYFAPFETHLSTEKFYTSDYDLSTFSANQYGFGVSYTDLFAKAHLFSFGLKNIDLRINHYSRSDGLSANIGTIGFKFVFQ